MSVRVDWCSGCRADDPAQLLDQLTAWRPNGGADLREEVAWLRMSDSSFALVPTSAGLGLPGGLRGPGERGVLALCRLMDQHWAVRLRPVAEAGCPELEQVSLRRSEHLLAY